MLSPHKTRSFLTAAIAIISIVQTANAGRTLHVIVAADKTDASIGKYCQTDAAKIESVFAENVHHQELKLHQVPTANLNQTGINSVLQNAMIRPEDAVVFYYSGHGNYARDGQHYLVVNGSWTSRSWLIGSLQSRGAGLTALITDSCFNFNDVDPPTKSATRQVRMAMTTPLFRKLFFETNGFIDINSCQRDEKAATHADHTLGSVFTKAFRDTLATKTNMGSESWHTIMNSVASETADQFRSLHPDGETLETGDGNFVNQRSQTVAQLAMNVYGHDPGPGAGGGPGPGPGPGGNDPIESFEFEYNINPRSGHTTEKRIKYTYFPSTGHTQMQPGPLKALGKASIVRASDNTPYWRWPRVKNPDIVMMDPIYVQAVLSGGGGSPGDKPGGGGGGGKPGLITSARLGVTVKNWSGQGIMIRKVTAGGAATKCLGSDGNIWRLEAGDRITQINGRPISTVKEFSREVRNSPSTMALVVFCKDGKYHHMTANLNGGGIGIPTPIPPPPGGKGPRLGVTVSTMPGLGVVVTSVVPGTPATRCRYGGKNYKLEVGDMITRVNGRKITSEASFAKAIRSSGKAMSFRVKDIAKNKTYDFTTTLSY